MLAWISTDRNWPHKTPSRMPIFRVLSHRCCDAKGYADNPIALRLLAHRLCDSGHFRDPRGEKRSEEHTSELQSPDHIVCRLLLEKKKKNTHRYHDCVLHT